MDPSELSPDDDLMYWRALVPLLRGAGRRRRIAQEIDHAGYRRHIVSRNPPQLDEYDDEDDDEVDEEADAEAAERNPYAGMKLERTAKKTLSPSSPTLLFSLPTHPAIGGKLRVPTPLFSISLSRDLQASWRL
jgi:hypothetical protein